MTRRSLTAAEAAVLEAHLPAGLTDDMRELAWCLFAALAERDARAGSASPQGPWLAVLHTMAQVAVQQLQQVCAQLGGRAMYLPKGLMVFLSARDEQLCAQFRGNNHLALARQYGLTEMRVRQILSAWQAEQLRSRQGRLPGIDEP